MLESLKGLLNAEPSDKAKRRAEITRLVHELQTHRCLAALRRKCGSPMTDPVELARSLASYWSFVMSDKGGLRAASGEFPGVPGLIKAVAWRRYSVVPLRQYGRHPHGL